MRALRAVLGLSLLGALRAFPQDGARVDACATDPSRYYDEAARRCCYRCPEGLSAQQPCPQGSWDCQKQCEPDYYLGGSGGCLACVSCSEDDLVEKMPCSWNSSRVCECRAGMFCVTSATNSCARCSPHSVCSTGMIVKFPGTAERDTVCESPSPGTSPDCSISPEDCKAPASGPSSQAKPSLTSLASNARTMLLGKGAPLRPEDGAEMMKILNSSSSAGKPSSDPGLALHQPCPQGSADCQKQCEPDYYLERDGRCTACVSCSEDDLVEKTPCMWNSSRICECRPGMFCVTSATNSCARCVTLPVYSPGTVTKHQGLAERDTTYELPPPEAHQDCSTSPEDSEAPTSTSPFLTSPAGSQTSQGHGGGITHAWGDTILTSAPISFSSTGKPILVSGPVLFWVLVALMTVIGSVSFLLCHRRACRKWIRQKLHLCYPVQTFQPKLEPADSRSGKSPTQPKRSASVAELSTGELGLMGTPAVETCPSVGAACLESLKLLDASPAESPGPSRDPPEPRVATEQTNNRIEKIYIMKADTVIVGTVKTEVPEGRSLVGPAGPEFEEDLEVDHAPHYPEQETEPPLGSCRDVMFSVEEEGKEGPLPTTVSGK
ncbi:tumor necrosis factor receptor superfamily member 8 [Manis pentadactyla]|uniref:tumor necrosis factor receptor superfamily member 8 n=1 Tax=Manis pentadactyla TaxID=143292 RepID=UPI00255C4B52|nr:tumor necrosis factor receptor superfamily member 8 [Manis pentadactyla]